MLGPENPNGAKSAKTLGTSSVTMYLTTESVDKVIAKAVKLGATARGPVMDMFWGDRVGNISDPDGYTWMIATHVAEPTPKEMQRAMKAMSQMAGA
jgi:PhnB protein